MPLKANIGLTRKVTDNNYGSKGASVNLEIELDTSLVNYPDKLQDRLRRLFDLVRTSLVQELNGGDKLANEDAPASHGSNGTAHHHHADHTRPAEPGAEPRAATPKQIKALQAIARQQDIRLNDFLFRNFSVNRPGDLTVKQASRAIDELKAWQVPANGAA